MTQICMVALSSSGKRNNVGGPTLPPRSPSPRRLRCLVFCACKSWPRRREGIHNVMWRLSIQDSFQKDGPPIGNAYISCGQCVSLDASCCQSGISTHMLTLPPVNRHSVGGWSLFAKHLPPALSPGRPAPSSPFRAGVRHDIITLGMHHVRGPVQALYTLGVITHDPTIGRRLTRAMDGSV